jgi:plastocyanin
LPVAASAASDDRRTGGPIAQSVDTIEIGDRNVECSSFPAGARIKVGTNVTFTNVGNIAHTAIAIKQAQWDTGVLEKGQSKAITFFEPGIYFYICASHPRMYGEVTVEK